MNYLKIHEESSRDIAVADTRERDVILFWITYLLFKAAAVIFAFLCNTCSPVNSI